MYACTSCRFKTSRELNFTRHLETAKHQRLVNFTLDEYYDNHAVANTHSSSESEGDQIIVSSVDEYDYGSDDNNSDRESMSSEENADLNEDEDQDKTERSSFFPFKNKLHLLLYVFKNSPTHPVVCCFFSCYIDLLIVE